MSGASPRVKQRDEGSAPLLSQSPRFLCCSQERLVGVVRLLAHGSSQLGCGGDPWPGRRHHRSGAAVVRAALSPALLSRLPE